MHTQAGAHHYSNPAQDKELEAECESIMSPNIPFSVTGVFYVAKLSIN